MHNTCVHGHWPPQKLISILVFFNVFSKPIHLCEWWGSSIRKTFEVGLHALYIYGNLHTKDRMGCIHGFLPSYIEHQSMMLICPLEIACQNLFLQVCGFAWVDSMSYAMVFWLGPIFACRSFIEVTRRVEKALSCCRGRVWLHTLECCTKHLVLT